ncbi:hypothetical protein [Rhodanobacter sp. BL-MT-08]
MSTPISELLMQLFTAMVVAVVGWVIRTRGPQGLVHGIVDWNKVDEAKRQRAGRDIGNVFFAMTVWMAGFGVYRYEGFYDLATDNLAHVIFIGGLCALVLLMLLMLLRLRENQRTHGR